MLNIFGSLNNRLTPEIFYVSNLHNLKAMRLTDLVGNNADLDSIIYKARELYPEIAGIIDPSKLFFHILLNFVFYENIIKL
jgi:hypothetical protein